jgi:hypothetical protein
VPEQQPLFQPFLSQLPQFLDVQQPIFHQGFGVSIYIKFSLILSAMQSHGPL